MEAHVIEQGEKEVTLKVVLPNGKTFNLKLETVDWSEDEIIIEVTNPMSRMDQSNTNAVLVF